MHEANFELANNETSTVNFELLPKKTSTVDFNFVENQTATVNFELQEQITATADFDFSNRENLEASFKINVIPDIDLSNYATKDELNQKQDIISDLTTIRSGASLGATAVQPTQLATVATTGSYNDLTDKPEIGGETYTAGNGLNLINNNFELLQQDFGVKGVEVVGTLTKDGLTYSGFSSSDYLTIPAQKTLTGTDSYEIQFKFRTPSLTINSQQICFFATNYALTVSSRYVYLYLPTYTSSRDTFYAVRSPQSNTDYIVNIKRIQDAISYTTIIKYSTDDGETWTETKNSTTNFTCNNLALSGVKIGQGYGGGVIYLDKSFIKVNGEDWWNPLNDTFRPVARATESLYGLIKPDNNTIVINDGVISTSLTDVQVNGASILSDGVANIPIPTMTSQLTNNSDFTTKSYVDGLVGNIETLLANINSGS